MILNSPLVSGKVYPDPARGPREVLRDPWVGQRVLTRKGSPSRQSGRGTGEGCVRSGVGPCVIHKKSLVQVGRRDSVLTRV